MKHTKELEKVLPKLWQFGQIAAIAMIFVTVIFVGILTTEYVLMAVVFGIFKVALFALLTWCISHVKIVFADMRSGKTFAESIAPRITVIFLTFYFAFVLRNSSDSLIAEFSLQGFVPIERASNLNLFQTVTTYAADFLIAVMAVFSALEFYVASQSKNRSAILGISNQETRAKIAKPIRICSVISSIGYFVLIAILAMNLLLREPPQSYIALLLLSMISYILSICVLLLLFSIMRHIENDTPFAADCAPKMRILGILYGVMFVGNLILNILSQMPSSATGTADSMSIISYLNSNITVEISHLNPVVCIILLVLSAIFDHAAKLQKQSDEML